MEVVTHGPGCPLAGQERPQGLSDEPRGRLVTPSMRLDRNAGECISVDQAVARILAGRQVLVCSEATVVGVMARGGADEAWIDSALRLCLAGRL